MRILKVKKPVVRSVGEFIVDVVDFALYCYSILL